MADSRRRAARSDSREAGPSFGRANSRRRAVRRRSCRPRTNLGPAKPQRRHLPRRPPDPGTARFPSATIAPPFGPDQAAAPPATADTRGIRYARGFRARNSPSPPASVGASRPATDAMIASRSRTAARRGSRRSRNAAARLRDRAEMIETPALVHRSVPQGTALGNTDIAPEGPASSPPRPRRRELYRPRAGVRAAAGTPR